MQTILIDRDQFSLLHKLVNSLGVSVYRDAKKTLGFGPMSAIQSYTRLNTALLIDQLQATTPSEQAETSLKAGLSEPPVQIEQIAKPAMQAARTVITLGEARPGTRIRFLGQRVEHQVTAKTSTAIKFETADRKQIKATSNMNYWGAEVEIMEVT